MIVVIANTKGGVGKSTLAVHLAGWLHKHGQSVVLADCDPQRSSSEWVGDAVPGVTGVPLPGANEILNELPKLAERAAFVVADGPGSNSEVSRALLLRADVAVVPCKASMLEVRALASATEVLRQAQDIRGGLPEAHIVLSMVGSRHRLTRDMKEAAAALELPLAPVPIVLRQAYADAPGQKALVWELGSRGREAANELDALFEHLLPSVRQPAKPKPRGAA